jgi:hypothetical protein
MVEAVETYTSVLTVLSAALLLVAAGRDKKQLVSKRLALAVAARDCCAGCGYGRLVTRLRDR